MANRANSRQVDQADALAQLVEELGDWAIGSAPLFRQLARRIASGIERGVLGRGTRLPPERGLAAALVISRGTAVAAYDLLVADGLIERRQGSGTYVLGAGALGLPPGREGSALVHRLVELSAGPSSIIDLSISVLHDASDLPPVSLTSTELNAVTPDTGYSPWGLTGLRSAVADHMAEWGLPSGAEEIVITTGAQQAISAAAACWLRPGDTVVVEDPTYPGAIAAFGQAGARLRGVGVDRSGVRVDELAAAIADRPALVYLQSTVHSPTGVVLSESRRRRIAALITDAGAARRGPCTRRPRVGARAATDRVVLHRRVRRSRRLAQQAVLGRAAHRLGARAGTARHPLRQREGHAGSRLVRREPGPRRAPLALDRRNEIHVR